MVGVDPESSTRAYVIGLSQRKDRNAMKKPRSTSRALSARRSTPAISRCVLGLDRPTVRALQRGVYLVAVFLRCQLGREPLTGINPQPRSGHRYAPSEAVVLARIVSNINCLGGHEVGLPLSRARISPKTPGKPG
jgi:hypothetical protein